LFPRVVPVLLRTRSGLVKTVRFADPKYIGDPMNAVKIFSEKEADELIFLDITATVEGRGPDVESLARVAEECFMPLAYGGGVRSLADIKAILKVGVEKIVVNTYAVENPVFIQEATDLHGSSTIAVAIDVKRSRFGGYEIRTRSGGTRTGIDPVQFAVQLDAFGAGELLVNAIDRDGTMAGYDLELLRQISREVRMPVIACGGAGQLAHFTEAVEQGGASAVAAGSMFVFHGKHRAVLISYPAQDELEALFTRAGQPPDRPGRNEAASRL
jgi:cyclase